MTENTVCPNLATCIFVRYYETSKGNNLALKGFINTYCKGKEQDKCKRKKISKALGGPMHVPPNMMPNGMALTGTNTALWTKEVAALV